MRRFLTQFRLAPTFGAVIFVVAGVGSPAQQPATAPIVLHAARLLEVDTGNILQPGEILVEGERIKRWVFLSTILRVRK